MARSAAPPHNHASPGSGARIAGVAQRPAAPHEAAPCNAVVQPPTVSLQEAPSPPRGDDTDSPGARVLMMAGGSPGRDGGGEGGGERRMSSENMEKVKNLIAHNMHQLFSESPAASTPAGDNKNRPAAGASGGLAAGWSGAAANAAKALGLSAVGVSVTAAPLAPASAPGPPSPQSPPPPSDHHHHQQQQQQHDQQQQHRVAVSSARKKPPPPPPPPRPKEKQASASGARGPSSGGPQKPSAPPPPVPQAASPAPRKLLRHVRACVRAIWVQGAWCQGCGGSWCALHDRTCPTRQAACVLARVRLQAKIVAVWARVHGLVGMGCWGRHPGELGLF